MADKFASNPNVIGFDPINEPARAWDSLPELFRQDYEGKLSRDELQPLYSRVFKALQDAKKSAIMWFEPPIVDQAWKLGFSKPPGGEPGDRRHMLNEHSYCSFDIADADRCHK